jgi:2-methylisocitrate lyase-like PEP mutase family enzyme
VLYANAALQAALRASTTVLTALRDEGSLNSVSDLLAGFEERQRSVNKDLWDGLEAKYRQAN